jgi:hypothetical protein
MWLKHVGVLHIYKMMQFAGDELFIPFLLVHGAWL